MVGDNECAVLKKCTKTINILLALYQHLAVTSSHKKLQVEGNTGETLFFGNLPFW